MMKTMLGESDASCTSPIFYSRPPDRKSFYGFENLPDLAVREGAWKLLCDYDGGRPELYHIVNDPGGTYNFADEYIERVKSMTQEVTSGYKFMPASEVENHQMKQN